MTTAAAGRAAAPLETVAAIDTELARLQVRHEALEAEAGQLTNALRAAERLLADAVVAGDTPAQERATTVIDRTHSQLRAIASGQALIAASQAELKAVRQAASRREALTAYDGAEQRAIEAVNEWGQRFAAWLREDFARYGLTAQSAYDRAALAQRRASHLGAAEPHMTALAAAWKQYPELGRITHDLAKLAPLYQKPEVHE